MGQIGIVSRTGTPFAKRTRSFLGEVVPEAWGDPTTMTAVDQIKVVCILGPIFALLALGLSLTLRNGIGGLASCQGTRQLVQNLSKTVMMLAVCLVGLMLVQQLIGVRLSLMW